MVNMLLHKVESYNNAYHVDYQDKQFSCSFVCYYMGLSLEEWDSSVPIVN